MHKFLFYNRFIIFLYMFRALLCSSSGGQNWIIQHLVITLCRRLSGGPDAHLQSMTIPDAVKYNFDLLTMSTTVLETCRGI